MLAIWNILLNWIDVLFTILGIVGFFELSWVACLLFYKVVVVGDIHLRDAFGSLVSTFEVLNLWDFATSSLDNYHLSWSFINLSIQVSAIKICKTRLSCEFKAVKPVQHFSVILNKAWKFMEEYMQLWPTLKLYEYFNACIGD